MINPSVACFYAEELIRRQDSAAPGAVQARAGGQEQRPHRAVTDEAVQGSSGPCDTRPFDMRLRRLHTTTAATGAEQ